VSGLYCIRRKLVLTPFRCPRRRVRPGSPPPPPPVGRLPRVTKLLALAIHFDELLRTGAVTSQAELARLGRVSRPRLTQIMNLLHLCPTIQAEILAHPSITSGRDPITERELRSIVGKPDWTRHGKKRCQDSIASAVN